MKPGKILLPLCALLLAGCAGWPKHGVELTPPRKLKVAVLPLSEAVSIKKLDYIITLSSGAQRP